MQNTANLFVVGAAKAGSTAICSLLGQNKNIYVPALKEPRYYVAEHIRNVSKLDPLKNHIINNSTLNMLDYQNLYKGRKEKYLLDGSIHYLYNYQEVIPQIKHDNPNAKIIIILREPVARALSNFRFLSQYVKYDFKNSQEHEDAAIKNNFNSFWFYFNQGLYVSQVKSYLAAFDSVHVCFYEDFVNTPQTFIDQIYTFLELPTKLINLSDNARINMARTPRNLILRNLHRYYVKTGVSLPDIKLKSTIRQMLFKTEKSSLKTDDHSKFSTIFTDEIDSLESLLGVDLCKWKI